MDVVVLVLDSLSFRATPFADDGPDTMPALYELAIDEGVVFENAYAPGPLSPSSHAAMLTGRLPSAAGMHEAHPYFDGRVETIAGAMSESHETSLLSLNMWLFQGLHADFSHSRDFSRQYRIFESGTDPVNYFRKHDPDGSFIKQLGKFAFHDGRPVRSLANYVSYKLRNENLVPERWGDAENYQFANKINAEIRQTLARGSGDQFVVANYMDIHPPFDASPEAKDRFVSKSTRSKLPIGSSPERHIQNEEKSYSSEAMEELYRAAIWDLDRKLTPLVRDLIDDNTFVVVTSDHGIWDRDTAHSENRLHVPLVIFGPSDTPRTVPYTVSLQSLPRTIVEATGSKTSRFPGCSLLRTDDHQLAITEIIHHPNEVYEKTGRVDVTKSKEADKELQRDLVLVKGDARLEYTDGRWSQRVDDRNVLSELRDEGERILSTPIHGQSLDVEYDDVTARRLEDLGYM